MTTTLVTGATGKVGKHVVPLLAERGETVRAASRHPDGEHGVRFDWADDSTWDTALEGAERLFLVAQAEGVTDPTGPVLDLLERAQQAGVGRVVMLSAMGIQFAPDEIPLRRVEKAVQAADVESTLVRPNWFDQNFNESIWLPTVREGRLPAPVGDAEVSFVDTRDIAAVAVEALVADGHAGQEYTVTGPEAITFDEAAAAIAEASGRPVERTHPSDDEFAALVVGGGYPEGYAQMLVGLMQPMKQGANAPVDPAVEQVTGRRARTVAEFARDHADDWR